MTTTERTGDTPVAPPRRTKTAAAPGEPAAAQGEPAAAQADSAAPRPRARASTTPAVAVLGPARTTTLAAESVDPYRSVERVWPD
ncbi:hypothetical protein [Candidatus Thiodictyon syntrophicum]|jgi:hypothetical protein|uniref:Uncharacterized protein n=1 Tax=Candidatus Thiodictyon syntrophicum TaxID=1166950 RepID=A0A2K8UHL3_9GAMM|nr:hypothetical protein [Candidatus Thiodictyon syntrophicum]AUB85074.1 hypothetical protein THSYN_29525 [Candidatus Thiodictyon syntrophicum]